MGSNYRRLGLDPAELRRASTAAGDALRGGRAMTRPELVATLSAAGVDTAEPVRLAHIVMHVEVTGVLCSGPAREGQTTYALLDERVRHARAVDDTAARDELARALLGSDADSGEQRVIASEWFDRIGAQAAPPVCAHEAHADPAVGIGRQPERLVINER